MSLKNRYLSVVVLNMTTWRTRERKRNNITYSIAVKCMVTDIWKLQTVWINCLYWCNVFVEPIPVTERSKTTVCRQSLAEIVGSNPAGGMDVCLFWVSFFVRWRPLRLAHPSSRGILQTVMSHCVRSRNLKNKVAVVSLGLLRQSGKKCFRKVSNGVGACKCVYIYIYIHIYTRWFKYDRDKLWRVYTQSVPVIFEPPCIWFSV